MKIKRINLALTAFKKMCELGTNAKLLYDIGTKELWCSTENRDASTENRDASTLVDVTELISSNPEWMASIYLYGMSRRLIEEVVKFINKKGE